MVMQQRTNTYLRKLTENELFGFLIGEVMALSNFMVEKFELLLEVAAEIDDVFWSLSLVYKNVFLWFKFMFIIIKLLLEMIVFFHFIV